MIQSRRV